MAKSSRSGTEHDPGDAPDDAGSSRAEYADTTMPIAATRTALATGTTTGMPLYVGPPHWRAAMATGTATVPTYFMAPPQGAGAPRGFRSEGSPMTEARLNCALRVLLDPIARTRSTRGYSGQSRNGNH